MIRSRNANLYALGQVEAKWFEDTVGLVPSRSSKKSRVATLGFSADTHDGVGGGSWGNLAAGWRFRKNSTSRARSSGRLTHSPRAPTAASTSSNFQLAGCRPSADRSPSMRRCGGRSPWTISTRQRRWSWAARTAYGVRAYPEGEAYGDQGVIGTAEARLTLSQWVRAVPGQLQAIAFIDVGTVDYAHDPWFAGRNRSHRSGIGGGLTWAAPDGFLVKASYARRLGDERVTSGPDHSGRAWFQIVKVF